MRDTAAMSDYAFTLRFALPRAACDAGYLIARLKAEGCGDANVCLTRKGWIAVQFARPAESPAEAVFGALASVLKVIPGARLVEAETDARLIR